MELVSNRSFLKVLLKNQFRCIKVQIVPLVVQMVYCFCLQRSLTQEFPSVLKVPIPYILMKKFSVCWKPIWKLLIPSFGFFLCKRSREPVILRLYLVFRIFSICSSWIIYIYINNYAHLCSFRLEGISK